MTRKLTVVRTAPVRCISCAAEANMPCTIIGSPSSWAVKMHSARAADWQRKFERDNHALLTEWRTIQRIRSGGKKAK